MEHDFDGHGGCVPDCRLCRIAALTTRAEQAERAEADAVAVADASFVSHQQIIKAEREAGAARTALDETRRAVQSLPRFGFWRDPTSFTGHAEWRQLPEGEYVKRADVLAAYLAQPSAAAGTGETTEPQE